MYGPLEGHFQDHEYSWLKSREYLLLKAERQHFMPSGSIFGRIGFVGLSSSENHKIFSVSKHFTVYAFPEDALLPLKEIVMSHCSRYGLRCNIFDSFGIFGLASKNELSWLATSTRWQCSYMHWHICKLWSRVSPTLWRAG
jgi:hypothetical protein